MPGPLRNVKHEVFAQEIAKRKSDHKAYQTAFQCSAKCAIKNAWRLRENEGIDKRVRELQRKSESRTTLTIQRRREIASEIAESTDFDPAIASVRLRATEVEAKHAGEYMDRTDLTTNGEALPTALPTIVINPPGAGYARRSRKT